jgi:hypothetical protein
MLITKMINAARIASGSVASMNFPIGNPSTSVSAGMLAMAVNSYVRHARITSKRQ